MKATQDILYAVASQSLHLDCESRPTSVTSVEVFEMADGDSDTAESATTGSASIDSASTTVDADSGPSNTTQASRLNVVDTSGFEVGRQYLVTSQTTGASEWIEAMAVASDDYIEARAPLFQDYGSGDLVESTRISISIDDSWAATQSNITGWRDPNPGYRVRWVYRAADGGTKIRYSYFDLARVAGQHNVTAADVDALVPGWLRMLPLDHEADQGARLISKAYEQVTIDLHAEGIPDQQARNQDMIDELTVRKTIVLTHEAKALAGGDPLTVELAREIYTARFGTLVKHPEQVKFDVSTDDSGAGHKRAAVRLTTR